MLRTKSKWTGAAEFFDKNVLVLIALLMNRARFKYTTMPVWEQGVVCQWLGIPL